MLFYGLCNIFLLYLVSVPKLSLSFQLRTIRSFTSLNHCNQYWLKQTLLQMSSIESNKDNVIVKPSIMDYVGESAKIIVSSSAGIILVSQSSSWKPIYYITGAVLNAMLSKVLKKIFKVPRPKESGQDGYGMPSSHAQSLFYFFSILSVLLLQYEYFPQLLRFLIVGFLGIYAVSAR